MPVLSVVIPTHERFRYARYTVDAVLRMSDDIEVVVSDTSTKDAWSDAGLYGSSDRLKIVRPPTGISVVDNFNIALGHATGDFICFIGDDDLVTPDVIQIVRRAAAEGVDAIRFAFPVLFYWHDYAHKALPEAYAGTIWASDYAASIRPLDTKRSLNNALAQLGRGVFDMPRIYCGIIARSLIDRVIERHGALFGGVSPDIYSAALLSAHATRVIDLDFPAVIPGASGASTAGQSAAGKHVGALRDNDHIRPFKNLVWHALVPEFYSVPTVWSYSFVRALEQIDEDLVLRANWGRLYAQCLMYHRRYRSETLTAMRAYARRTSPAALMAAVSKGIAAETVWAAKQVGKRLSVRHGTTKDLRFAGADDVDSALAIIGEVVAKGPKPVWPTTK